MKLASWGGSLLPERLRGPLFSLWREKGGVCYYLFCRTNSVSGESEGNLGHGLFLPFPALHKAIYGGWTCEKKPSQCAGGRKYMGVPTPTQTQHTSAQRLTMVKSGLPGHCSSPKGQREGNRRHSKCPHDALAAMQTFHPG